MKMSAWACAICAAALTIGSQSHDAAAQTTIAWDGGTTGGGTAWLTAANWAGDVVPGNTDIAQFAAAGTATNIGINFNSTTNAGTQTTGNRVEDFGAIELTSARTIALTIGNSSTTAGAVGKTRARGATVNGVADVILRNNSGQLLTIAPNAGGSAGGNQGGTFALGDSTDNIINIDGSGGITITSAITDDPLNAGAKKLTLGGSGSGILTLNSSTANTYTGKTTINSGTLSINNDPRLGTAPGSTVADHLTINGGTLRVTNTSQIFLAATRGLTIGANGATIDVFGNGTTATGTLTVDGPVTGNGNITKAATGGTGVALLQLTADNSNSSTGFGGKYIVNGGELLANTDASFGKVPASPVADYFTLNGGQLRANAATVTIDSNRGITLGANGGGFDTVNSGYTLAYDGVIAGGAGTGKLTKNGTSILSLGGANTYTGDTRVAAGVLVISNSLALQNSTLDMATGDAGTVGFGNSLMAATLGGLSGTRNLALQNGLGAIAVNVGNNGTSTTFSGALLGEGTLRKIGDGTLTLDSATGSNYGTAGVIHTIINDGKVYANNSTGSATGPGDVQVNSDGTLGGFGSVAGAVEVNGTGRVAPGTSIDSLDVGGLTLNGSSATLEMEINLNGGSPTFAADLLTVHGDVNLNGGVLELVLTNAPLTLGAPLTFMLVDNDGGNMVFGTFVPPSGAPAGYQVTVDYEFTGTDSMSRIGDGNDIAITLTTAAVPEASAFLFVSLACTAAGLARARWRTV